MTGAWRVYVAAGLGLFASCVSGCREPEEAAGPPEAHRHAVQPAQQPIDEPGGERSRCEGETASGPARRVDTESSDLNPEESQAGEAKEAAPNNLTPLHVAARRGDLAAIRDLLARGANPDARMADGSTPLHIAALVGKEEVVEALCRAGATVDARDDEGLTPLAMAQDAAVARRLIEHGADVNTRLRSGQTVLGYAVVMEYKDMCEALIDGGADLRAVDPATGMTLLQVAAQMGYAEIVELLIDRGADPNAMGGTGKAPLHLAVDFGYEGVVRVLLAKGADVNIMGKYGTPLHEAAMSGKAGVVRILLAHGANPEIRDASGATPLEMAISLEQKEVVHILLSATRTDKTGV